MRVVDQLGRVVFQQALKLNAGASQKLELPGSLSAGQYMVEAQQPNGQWLSTRLMLK